MAHTDKIEVATQAVVDRLQQVAHVETLGLAGPDDVTYGDQQKIPRTPFICVESGPQEVVLSGASNRVDNEFTIYVLVYISKLDSVQVNRKEADELATKVKEILHSNQRFTDIEPDDGLFHYSKVDRVEPGFAVRAGEKMRAARITFSAKSKTFI